jgi:hypothetical protein
VPDVANINASELTGPSRLGASRPRAVSFPGISVPVAARGKAAFAAQSQQPGVVATLLGQTNIHNYMTRAYAVGEGASGPPPEPPDSYPV